MIDYLQPVAAELEQAVEIAQERLRQDLDVPFWEIRLGLMGYYVVPPKLLGQGRWGTSWEYECLGFFVQQVSRQRDFDDRGQLPGEREESK